MLSFLLSAYGIRITLSGILILGIFIIQVTHKKIKPELIKKIIFLSVGALCVLMIHEATVVYETWYYSDFLRYFLPPHYSINYFAIRFFKVSILPWIISGFIGLILSQLAYWLNKRFEERFFEKEEIPLFALGAFLSGYPGVIFYLLVIVALELLLTVFYSALKWGRAPMYYLWLPGALFVMIIMYFFPLSFIGLFTF